MEAKRVLKEIKIHFQTPFPVKLRVFFQVETRIYGSADEATKHLAARGLPIKVIKLPETVAERIRKLTWCTAVRGRETESSLPRQRYKEKLKAFKRS